MYTKGTPEAFLVGSHFHTTAVDPYRTRKLLLHAKEIIKIQHKVTEKQITIVPTKIFITRGRAKLIIALGKGKKLYDKRETIKQRDLSRRGIKV